MFKIIEHKPVYAPHIEVETIEFFSTEQLLEIDFVKGHSKQRGFYRYSIKRDLKSARIPLLAEYDDGRKWIVIGFLQGDVFKIDLPDWEQIRQSA